MDEIEERARAQLMAIENIYAIKIKNREEVAGLIAKRVRDTRQVLMICTHLNAWIAMNEAAGEVLIPYGILAPLIEAAEGRR